jgi:DNA-binding NarL/FixJ family response regulator
MVSGAGGEDLPLVGAAWRAFFLEIAVAGWVALGRRDEAERAADAAEAIAASTGLRFAAFAALRARARVALAAGDAHGAAARSLESAARGGELGMPIYAAVSRTLAGRALAAAGEGERAAAELARAAEELDARGALRYRDEAEHELRRLGHRKLHRRTRAGKADGTGVESLTERELQIARLVVDRKTNSQIAAELFLSPKTVETHIRNLFHKLDVSSRVEVARVVERADQGR